MQTCKSLMKGFAQWYNTEQGKSHQILVTPAQRHNGEDKAILAKRYVSYIKAQEPQPLVKGYWKLGGNR